MVFSSHASLPCRHIVQVPLYTLQVLHIQHRTFTFVNHQRMIKVNNESDEYYEHRNDYHGAGSGSGEGIIPELDPAEDSHFHQKEKQSEYRGERPGQFDEAAHSLVRRLRHKPRHLKLAYGFDVG